jgi:hypothetical protein
MAQQPTIMEILLALLSVVAAMSSALAAIFSYVIVRRNTMESIRPLITLSGWYHRQDSVDHANHPGLTDDEEAKEP